MTHILYNYFTEGFEFDDNFYRIRSIFLHSCSHWIFPYSLIRNNIISDMTYYGQKVDNHFSQHDIYSVIKNYLEP